MNPETPPPVTTTLLPRVGPTELVIGGWREAPFTIDLLAPDPQRIELVDIAYGLAHTLRFGGQTEMPWTVAGHSLFALALAQHYGFDEATQRNALMHDAAEAFLGDMMSPVKRALRELEPTPTGMRSSFDTLEAIWCEAIDQRFGTSIATTHELVKRCDEIAFQVEDHALRGAPISVARSIFVPILRKIFEHGEGHLGHVDTFIAAALKLGLV